MNTSNFTANCGQFTRTTYNGISVIVDANGYYNASKKYVEKTISYLKIGLEIKILKSHYDHTTKNSGQWSAHL